MSKFKIILFSIALVFLLVTFISSNSSISKGFIDVIRSVLI